MVHLFFTAYSSGDQEAAKMCKGRCCSKLSAWLRAALNASLTACSTPSQACWYWTEALHAGVKRAEAPDGIANKTASLSLKDA